LSIETPSEVLPPPESHSALGEDSKAAIASSVSVEAGLTMMLTMMQTGKFKVLKHLHDWFEEFRLYHRRDGKVVKEGDDLMSATRYGIMMLRYATCLKDEKVNWQRMLHGGAGYGGKSWMN
jgi:hypothetical protein